MACQTSCSRIWTLTVHVLHAQAEIMGQSVTWLVPHQLAQVLPHDVDYKVGGRMGQCSFMTKCLVGRYIV